MTTGEWNATWLSLKVAAWAVLISLPLAIPVSYRLARGWPRAGWLVETVVNLPLVLPPVVTGFLLLALLGRGGIIGEPLERWFGLRLVFTWQAAVLAAAVVSFPLMVRAMRIAFEGIDPRLEAAARTLGAGRLDAFFTVTLPLAMRGVIAGCVLAFARSLGEFGATIMVAGNIEGETRTIPLAIYSLSHRPGGIEQTWRLVAVAVALACGALLISEALERKRRRHESA